MPVLGLLLWDILDYPTPISNNSVRRNGVRRHYRHRPISAGYHEAVALRTHVQRILLKAAIIPRRALLQVPKRHAQHLLQLAVADNEVARVVPARQADLFRATGIQFV